MARMLSGVVPPRWAIIAAGFAGLITAQLLRAEDEIRVSSPAGVLANPFTKRSAQPALVPDEPESSHRGPTTYQNPFARNAAAPPIEIPVRRGPASRWRRPLVSVSESSPIHAAILSSDPLNRPKQPWNELPPIDELRELAPERADGNDAPASPHFGSPPDPLQFAPHSIAQPSWLAATRGGATRPVAKAGAVTFTRPVIHDPFETTAHRAGGPAPAASGPVLGEPAPSVTTAVVPIENTALANAGSGDEPLVISDLDDPALELLAQAQGLAQTAASMDEHAAIISLCQRGLAAGPPDEVAQPLRRLAAWAHNRRGELLVDDDRPHEAIRDFQVAISLDPNCSLAIHNRAVSLAEANEPAAALRDFNRVIELNPGLAIAYRNRAELLASLGRIEEALGDYTRAIEGLPLDAELFRARGSAFHRAGDYNRALADLNRAIELQASADAYTQRGNVLAEKGQFDAALGDFRQAIAVDPQWGEAYRSLAWLMATCANPRHRDAEQALAAARHAAELATGEDYFVLDTLAAAHACAGQFDDARQIQQQAVAAAPPDWAEPLRQRLALYQQDQAFVSGPQARVRTASHERETRRSAD